MDTQTKILTHKAPIKAAFGRSKRQLAYRDIHMFYSASVFTVLEEER